jgi:dynein light chain LC8-type
MTELRKFKILQNQMPSEMTNDAVNFTALAYAKHNNNADVATTVKNEFDKKYGLTWHCIVGRNFDSYIHPAPNTYIWFETGEDSIELFKSH